MEGLVLAVTPTQEVSIALGSDDGLKVGDTLHVRRQAPDGSSRSLAIIVVKDHRTRLGHVRGPPRAGGPASASSARKGRHRRPLVSGRESPERPG